ncbi:MAG: hypothetical protein GY754_27590 [bacterium]|nr:hypothetical protein [bacterium]
MARVELKDRWQTTRAYTEIMPLLIRFFDAYDIRIEKSGEGELHGYQGSQLRTRLLGGIFINVKYLPKRVQVSYAKNGEGAEIDILIEEAMGIGSLIGMKDKYSDYFSLLRFEMKKETE